MEAVRAREEALAEMLRHSGSLESIAGSANKELKEMNPWEMGFQQQADMVRNLRKQICALDAEIVDETINLGEWKQVMAREWMGVLFGGLLECSENDSAIGRSGIAIVQSVPTWETQRSPLQPHDSGHSHAEPLVAEAERKPHSIPPTSEAGDRTPQPPNPRRTGDVGGNPDSPPGSLHEIGYYGEDDSHSRSRYPRSPRFRSHSPRSQYTRLPSSSSSSLIQPVSGQWLAQGFDATKNKTRLATGFSKRPHVVYDASRAHIDDPEMQDADRCVVEQPSFICGGLNCRPSGSPTQNPPGVHWSVPFIASTLCWSMKQHF